MGTFCARCQTEIGWFSSRSVSLADGTTITVCKACAKSPQEVQQERSVQAPYREAAHPSGELAALEAAFRDNPSSLQVLFDLGQLSLRLAESANGEAREQHLDRAAKVFRAMLLQRFDASPPCSKASVFYFLAVTSHLRGEPAKAIQMAERAVDLQPELAEAKSLLARLRA
ncbi:MAG: hypothetical protein HY898_12425 [Deltaproteobacteria bacterium]|nr:hypothetical protein [Deltaproteobacteria bacterium]